MNYAYCAMVALKAGNSDDDAHVFAKNKEKPRQRQW